MTTESTETNSSIDLSQVETLIDKKLTEQLAGFQQALGNQVSKEITGAIGRVKKDIGSELSGQFQAQLAEISEQLKGQSASAEREEPQAQSKAATPEDLTRLIEEKVKSATAATRSEYQQQLQNQAEQLQALQKISEENEERAKKAKQDASLARIESKFAEKAADSVINPNKFFQYLQQVEGSLEIDLDTQEAFIKTGKTDTFGNEVRVKATEYIPELLKREEYSHWAKPRPGSGSGEQPGNSGYSQSKYFGAGSTVSTNDLVQMIKQGKGDELMQDLIKAESA